MFCGKCGTKLREDAQFCQKCGTALIKTEAFTTTVPREEPMPQTESRPVQQEVYQTVYRPQPTAYYAPGTHPYHQLGGFLLLQVVSSYITGALSFIHIITSIISYSTQMKMAALMPGPLMGFQNFDMIGGLILNLIIGCVAITYANKIRRKESDVLHYMQSSGIIMLILIVVFRSIEFVWLRSILKQYRYNGALLKYLSVGTIVLMLVIGILGLFLASLYYSRSVRVRTYMGSDDYLRESVFNKHTVSPTPADGSDQPGVVKPGVVVSFNPEKQWYCTQCGRINENYTTTCGCGMIKPSGDLSKSWICKNCGRFNMGNLHRCAFCGQEKYQETEWTCSKCGSRNRSNESVCFVCGAANPKTKKGGSGDIPDRDEWVCHECGTINAHYVGTCGCGCRKL